MRKRMSVALSALALFAAMQVHAEQGASGGMPSKIMQTERPPQPTATMAGITPPRELTSHTAPPGTYPLLSQVQNEQGSALVRYTVNVDGSVSNPTIVKSSGFARLDAASMEMVTKWRYQPAMKDGKPIAVQSQTNVVWRLIEDPLEMLQDSPYAIVTMKPEDYPADAKAQKQEGVVIIMISLDENGEITNSSVVRSSGVQSLDDAALEFATRHWHVKPASVDGKPIKTMVGLGVIWSLSGK